VSSSTAQHRDEASRLPAVRAAVITISDTRTRDTDKSGALIIQRLESAGHRVIRYEILPDEPDQIRELVASLATSGEIQVVLTNGGTGIAPRDGTFEAISGLLTKELPGFGEIFRMLSWDEVGPAAMLSRAIGGLIGQTLVFSMPGSSNAVALAMDKLIVPELAHLVWEMNRR
jgi:molybdenum cofactor biosynthesis protein B